MFDFIKKLFPPKQLAEAVYNISNEDADGWRNIGQKSNEKSLNPGSREGQLRLVFSLWLKNGFAKQLIQLPIDFIIGESMFLPEFKSKDDVISEEKLEACADIIKDFVEKNKFAIKFEKFAIDLSLNGLLLLPCKNSASGDVTIGFIDPSKIDSIVTNPYDVTEVTKVKMKTDFTAKAKVFDIVKKKSPFTDEDAEDYDMLSGDAFYYAVNNVSNQPEGVSDLLADIDMIKKLYELLMSVVESVKLANLFVLDTTMTGADDATIQDYAKKHPLPTRPTNRIHNDKVETKLFGGTVTAFNSHEVIRTIKNFILGNFGLPPFWFADGEDANRAISLEQGTPTYKKLEKRQELLLDMLKNIYLYVIHSAVRDKEGFNLTKDDLKNLILQIKAPEIQVKNLETLTASLEKLTTSLGHAQQSQWLTDKTIRKSYISFINMLGFDINAEVEEAELEKQIKENPPEEINPLDPNNPNPENPTDPNQPKPKMKIINKNKVA